MLKRTPLRAKTRLVSKKPLSKKSRNKKKNDITNKKNVLIERNKFIRLNNEQFLKLKQEYIDNLEKINLEILEKDKNISEKKLILKNYINDKNKVKSDAVKVSGTEIYINVVYTSNDIVTFIRELLKEYDLDIRTDFKYGARG